MCDTKLCSFRVPLDVLAKLDAEAQRDGRSRSAVLTRILQRTTFTDAGLTYNGLVDNPSRSTRCTQPGHTGFVRSDGYWCTVCRKMY